MNKLYNAKATSLQMNWSCVKLWQLLWKMI